MKKLITLFSFLAFISLIFIGCQSTENITAPEDLSKAPPASFIWGDPSTSTVVDLVAGQTHKVGTVTVAKVGDCGLKVTYKLSAAGKIDEVHVDLALDPANFTVNKQNSPTFGNFDSKTFGATIGGIGSDEVTVTFDCDQLKAALGPTFDPNAPTKIYIAAHSGVCMETGEYSAEAAVDFCPELNADAEFLDIPSFAQEVDGITYYFKGTLSEPLVAGGSTVLGGWCLDAEKNITSDQGGLLVNRVCYTDFDCIDQEILSKINWIINHREVTWTWREVQDAIYILLGSSAHYGGNPSIVSAILTAAADKGSWVPTECGQKVLIIAFDGDGENCESISHQITAWEVPVKCAPVYKCDTAMGFNYPTNDGKSAPFNHQWFRYFAFSY